MAAPAYCAVVEIARTVSSMHGPAWSVMPVDSSAQGGRCHWLACAHYLTTTVACLKNVHTGSFP